MEVLFFRNSTKSKHRVKVTTDKLTRDFFKPFYCSLNGKCVTGVEIRRRQFPENLHGPSISFSTVPHQYFLDTGFLKDRILYAPAAFKGLEASTSTFLIVSVENSAAGVDLKVGHGSNVLCGRVCGYRYIFPGRGGKSFLGAGQTGWLDSVDLLLMHGTPIQLAIDPSNHEISPTANIVAPVMGTEKI